MIARLSAAPMLTGLLVALIAWWASLYPTLIPRDWLIQGVVSGTSAAIGYGIGTLAGYGLQRLGLRADGLRADSLGGYGRIAVAVAWIAALLGGAVVWPIWQNDLRDLVQMPHVGTLDAVLAMTAGLVIGAILVIVGRLVGRGLAAVHRSVSRFLPGWLAAPVTLALIALLIVVVGHGVGWRGLTAGASAIFAPANAGTNPGTVEPTSSTVSGGPGSAAAWDTLGRQGRDFVAGAVSEDEVRAFYGDDATFTEPVRVYVGTESAETAEARARLAVSELERTGGFEREVLAVWIPTGTGWVEANAARALEMLHAGDTAIVSIQYSYLPSLLAVFMDPGGSIDAGLELFNAVEDRWQELPEGSRPKLVVFGMSLGTAGGEAPFAGEDMESSVANMAARIDGALLVGAKFHNPVLSQLTVARDPGSPAWHPTFDSDETVRFVTRGPADPPVNAETEAPRVVYLQHPSDPVPYWGVDHIWSPPEWMDRPRGHGVSDQAVWFPIVSSIASAADLFGQLSTPPGFGHVYDRDYLWGWAQVVPPPGLTDADVQRLEGFLFPDEE